jgi:hypothetical protein
MGDVLSVKPHMPVTIFAAKLCCSIAQCVHNCHGDPLPPFRALTKEELFDFAMVDRFVHACWAKVDVHDQQPGDWKRAKILLCVSVVLQLCYNCGQKLVIDEWHLAEDDLGFALQLGGHVSLSKESLRTFLTQSYFRCPFSIDTEHKSVSQVRPQLHRHDIGIRALGGKH